IAESLAFPGTESSSNRFSGGATKIHGESEQVTAGCGDYHPRNRDVARGSLYNPQGECPLDLWVRSRAHTQDAVCPEKHSFDGHREACSQAEGGRSERAVYLPEPHDPNKPHTCLKRAHAEALKGAKIKSPFRIYDLRHTLGSRSAMAGVGLPILKELMGHSEVSTTLRYIHPT